MAIITSTVSQAIDSRSQRKDVKRAAAAEQAGIAEARNDINAGYEAAIPLINQGYDDARGSINNYSGRIFNNFNTGEAAARGDINAGFGDALNFLNTGYEDAIGTLNPLASTATQYTDEQANLLGLNGDQSYQDALSRVNDPLQAEQERAFRRNSAMFGGSGLSGNVLSALAEQTRNRTAGNIDSRVNLLGQAGSPALNALQQISQMQLSQGQDQSNLATGQAGALSGISQNFTNNRGNALQNIMQMLSNLDLSQGQQLGGMEVDQGNVLAQLSQNMGTANAAPFAWGAQQSPWSNALSTGLNAFGGLGGFSGGGSTAQSGSTPYGYMGPQYQQWLAGQGG